MSSRLPKGRASSEPPAFYSVAATAKMLGTSEMTLYRAIHDGQFPAVRVRGRLIVPAKVIDALATAAVDGQCLIDTATWVADGER
ncbi:MAG: helix-turn-helix domain-containing protein [Sporichthyaceae bacterium]